MAAAGDASDGVADLAAAGGDDVSKLTADEAEQYDRQIRLWGLEAQKR